MEHTLFACLAFASAKQSSTASNTRQGGVQRYTVLAIGRLALQSPDGCGWCMINAWNAAAGAASEPTRHSILLAEAQQRGGGRTRTIVCHLWSDRQGAPNQCQCAAQCSRGIPAQGCMHHRSSWGNDTQPAECAKAHNETLQQSCPLPPYHSSPWHWGRARALRCCSAAPPARAQ